MAEPEDPVTNKRKASPELSAEDVAAKRSRVEDGDEHVRSADGDSEMRDDHNGVTPSKEERHDKSPRSHRVGSEPDARRSPEARRPSVTGPVRGKPSLEDKKRGRRLFGGLVSTLSRTTTGSQQQKRQEIERRHQEKAQQRRAEDEKRRIERLEKLGRTRRIQQVKLDEQAMKTRHSTMLARARSLQTRSEPRIHYLPWELTKEQEETIKDQIHAAEETVERETRDFKRRKDQRLRELGVSPPPRSPSPPPQKVEPKPETDTEMAVEEATVGEPIPPPQDTNPDDMAPSSSKERISHHDKDHDENGDEMMQDEEDTVIY